MIIWQWKREFGLVQNRILRMKTLTHFQSNGGGAILNKVKSAKFFIQFQIARVRTAKGETLSVADTVEHQLGKVIKVSMRLCML